MNFYYATNNPEEAKLAHDAGVDRVFVDTESKGKLERQKGKVDFLSQHTLSDVKIIRDSVPNANLVVRINPFFEDTQKEVDIAIDSGADIIMLPMFRKRYELEKTIEYINHRAVFLPLFENATAFARIDEFSSIEGVDEVFIGLNDLRIDMKLTFLFEPLSCGLIDWAAQILNSKHMHWGFGGIARIGEGTLPAELIIREHVRLKSEGVILGHVFRESARQNSEYLAQDIQDLNDAFLKARTFSKESLDSNRKCLKQTVYEIVVEMENLQ